MTPDEQLIADARIRANVLIAEELSKTGACFIALAALAERLLREVAEAKAKARSHELELDDLRHHHRAQLAEAKERAERMERALDVATAALTDGPCECHDEYNIRKAHPCDRCAALSSIAAIIDPLTT